MKHRGSLIFHGRNTHVDLEVDKDVSSYIAIQLVAGLQLTVLDHEKS